MVITDETPLPKGAIDGLPVRARNVFNKMAIPKTYGGIRDMTYEAVLAEKNSGALTAQQLMEFRDKCLDGTIVPESAVVLQRADEPLPPLALATLSRRTWNVIDKHGIEKTPRGICELDRETVRNLQGAGKLVADELMALKQKCLDGSVWDYEEEPPVEEEILPGQFNSLSEYVKAVAGRTCQLDARKEKIIADYLGLLNVKRKKTLEEMGAELGGLTRERVRQIAAKLERAMFSDFGKTMFASFTACAASIFAQGNGVVKEGELVAGVNAAYPNWIGTTEFSVLRLLECNGIEIESNKSGLMAWMAGGVIERRYRKYLDLLEDENMALEDLAPEVVLQNGDSLGLEGMTENEYRFIVQRVFDNNHYAKGAAKKRWDLFLRLRCDWLRTSPAEQRRYAVARVLRAAGMNGLTHAEIVDACQQVDSTVVVGDESLLDADANPKQSFDLDGTGTRLIVYDFGDRTRAKRYSLDVFFRDVELIKVIKAAGTRLRRHMEKNCLGAANITRLRSEIQAELPEPYADGLPSACLYALMRQHEAGGLKYYDHPNVAHQSILDGNGKVPEQAISWLTYEYFLVAGHETATWTQLVDFCEVMLGMTREIAGATVVPAIIGEKVIVNGEECYRLKPPDETVEPPNVLLEGGEIDCELSFSESDGLQQMKLDHDGKALNFSTYVRSFLLELKKSKYAFTEDEETELADPGWCGVHLGPQKAVFLRAAPGSSRPNTNYWRVTYRVGHTDYWVNSGWLDKYKHRFDQWAQALAQRAGFTFEPYAIP